MRTFTVWNNAYTSGFVFPMLAFLMIHTLNLARGVAILVVTKVRVISSCREKKTIVLHLRMKNLDYP
jgi:hypothetical protein